MVESGVKARLGRDRIISKSLRYLFIYVMYTFLVAMGPDKGNWDEARKSLYDELEELQTRLHTFYFGQQVHKIQLLWMATFQDHLE